MPNVNSFSFTVIKLSQQNPKFPESRLYSLPPSCLSPSLVTLKEAEKKSYCIKTVGGLCAPQRQMPAPRLYAFSNKCKFLVLFSPSFLGWAGSQDESWDSGESEWGDWGIIVWLGHQVTDTWLSTGNFPSYLSRHRMEGGHNLLMCLSLHCSGHPQLLLQPSLLSRLQVSD